MTLAHAPAAPSIPEGAASRPVLLDLFCKAGGASMGYARAGFRVIGVDIEEQPRYPFPFVRADALGSEVRGLLAMGCVAAVHASPPCKVHTSLRHMAADHHADLIPATRELLSGLSVPWVIENVPLAPLLDPPVLCGTEFGLSALDQDGEQRWLRRHRLFESNVPLYRLAGCDRCSGKGRSARLIGGVYGGGGGAPRTAVSRVGKRRGGYQLGADEGRAILGTPWMTRDETAQAIPPAFTEHIGRQLMAALAE